MDLFVSGFIGKGENGYLDNSFRLPFVCSRGPSGLLSHILTRWINNFSPVLIVPEAIADSAIVKRYAGYLLLQKNFFGSEF